MTRTVDLTTAHACRAAAVAAATGSICLGIAGQWLAAAVVLWLVPSLLAVGGLAHRAHAKPRTIGREGDQ